MRRPSRSAADLAASGLEVDAVEALLPIPLHADGVVELLGYGWHVNLQKPMCNDLADAQRMLDAAQANDRVLRVMENYLFYEPLQKLKAMVESGEIGDVSGYHLKMVASGRGGWDVPMSSYQWQFQQMRRGRGILVFDDGWHKLATAIWLFGPIKEVRAWVGGTEVVPGVEVDAPTTIMWEHHNGIRGVWDITLAPDLYLRSDYYTNDERWEVTGRRGYAAREPMHGPRHSAAQPRGLRRRRDARLPRARRRLGEQLPRFRSPLVALAAHRRRPALVERRGSRRRVALRARRLREQRSRWRGCGSRIVELTRRDHAFEVLEILGDVGVALMGRPCRRCGVELAVSCVRVGTGTQEQLDHVAPPVGRGGVERGDALGAFRIVHVDAEVDEQLHRVQPARLDGTGHDVGAFGKHLVEERGLGGQQLVDGRSVAAQARPDEFVDRANVGAVRTTRREILGDLDGSPCATAIS